jgi:hypothetical protein
MKAIRTFLFVTFFIFLFQNLLIAQTLTSVNPNAAQQGEILAVAITGNNTHFAQGSSTTSIWLYPPFQQGSNTASSFYPVSDTLLIAEFLIPFDATPGLRDLNVYNNIDGTLTEPNIFTITPYNPTLTTITPSAAYQGQRLAVTITGQNTHFLQGSSCGQGSPTTWFAGPGQGSSTTAFAWLSQGSSTIFSRDGGAPGNELVMADLYIPEDANLGLWNVNVPNELDGLLTLPNAFRIGRPGDLTCDGMVNFLDLRVLGDNWLEGANP